MKNLQNSFFSNDDVTILLRKCQKTFSILFFVWNLHRLLNT